jgi:hypothetical protein
MSAVASASRPPALGMGPGNPYMSAGRVDGALSDGDEGEADRTPPTSARRSSFGRRISQKIALWPRPSRSPSQRRKIPETSAFDAVHSPRSPDDALDLYTPAADPPSPTSCPRIMADVAVPQLLRQGTPMTKVSANNTQKRIVLRLDPDQRRLVYETKRIRISACPHLPSWK